jgi:hypothetical protein
MLGWLHDVEDVVLQETLLGLIALLALALSAALWWTYFSHEESVDAAMLATPQGARRESRSFWVMCTSSSSASFSSPAGLKKAIPDPVDAVGWETAPRARPGSRDLRLLADTAMLRVLGVAVRASTDRRCDRRARDDRAGRRLGGWSGRALAAVVGAALVTGRPRVGSATRRAR